MTNSSNDRFQHNRFAVYEPRLGRGRIKVLFVVGSLGVSGGTNLILQNAQALIHAGAQVFITALKDGPAPDWNRASAGLQFLEKEQAISRQFDVAIATWWPTVYFLPKVKSEKYLYFIQSIESRFMDEDPRAAHHQELAEKTYSFDLEIITVARWIQLFLAHQYGKPTNFVQNGIKKELFSPFGTHFLERPHPKLMSPRLLIEGPQSVPFKGVSESISAAVDAGFDEIWHVGERQFSHPKVKHFSTVAYDQMPAIYRSCDILLKLSRVEGMYGPPLEMFHCGGTAVTYNVTGHSEYIRDGYNARLLEVGDYKGVVKALKELKKNPSEIESLKRGALDTANKWPSIETSGSDFARLVFTLSQYPSSNPGVLRQAILSVHDGENLI